MPEAIVLGYIPKDTSTIPPESLGDFIFHNTEAPGIDVQATKADWCGVWVFDVENKKFRVPEGCHIYVEGDHDGWQGQADMIDFYMRDGRLLADYYRAEDTEGSYGGVYGNIPVVAVDDEGYILMEQIAVGQPVILASISTSKTNPMVPRQIDVKHMVARKIVVVRGDPNVIAKKYKPNDPFDPTGTYYSLVARAANAKWRGAQAYT